MQTGPLQATLQSLQGFLNETTQKGPQTPDSIRQQAISTDFPYPELAAQVFKFLQSSKQTNLKSGLSSDSISDAFVALLLDPAAVEALGAGKGKDVWMNVRQALQSTGAKIGMSLTEVYQTCRTTGLGYTPTILDLASEMRSLFGALSAQGQAGNESQLTQLAQNRGLFAWQIQLAIMWMRRSKKAGALPTDADLEEIFTDESLLRELQEVDGPWEIYANQGEALALLRHFGQSLLDLADAVEEK